MKPITGRTRITTTGLMLISQTLRTPGGEPGALADSAGGSNTSPLYNTAPHVLLPSRPHLLGSRTAAVPATGDGASTTL